MTANAAYARFSSESLSRMTSWTKRCIASVRSSILSMSEKRRSSPTICSVWRSSANAVAKVGCPDFLLFTNEFKRNVVGSEKGTDLSAVLQQPVCLLRCRETKPPKSLPLFLDSRLRADLLRVIGDDVAHKSGGSDGATPVLRRRTPQHGQVRAGARRVLMLTREPPHRPDSQFGVEVLGALLLSERVDAQLNPRFLNTGLRDVIMICPPLPESGK